MLTPVLSSLTVSILSVDRSLSQTNQSTGWLKSEASYPEL